MLKTVVYNVVEYVFGKKEDENVEQIKEPIKTIEVIEVKEEIIGCDDCKYFQSMADAIKGEMYPGFYDRTTKRKGFCKCPAKNTTHDDLVLEAKGCKDKITLDNIPLFHNYVPITCNGCLDFSSLEDSIKNEMYPGFYNRHSGAKGFCCSERKDDHMVKAAWVNDGCAYKRERPNLND